MIMAEVLGTSNKSRVLDLFANDNNMFTPAYAIYEDGKPTRVALFNFMTDPTGENDYTASISIGGDNGESNASPTQVKVKYFHAESVSSKGNISWAGQVSSRIELEGLYLQTSYCIDFRIQLRVRWPANRDGRGTDRQLQSRIEYL